MLETLCAYGDERLMQAGERAAAEAALAQCAVEVAEQAAAKMQAGSEELAAIRWLDAEDATVQQALTWTLRHQPAVALRIAAALAKWWLFRGRATAGRELLRAVVAQAAPGSDAWCTAQFWLGDIADSASDALSHETAACEALEGRDPVPLLADVLAGRAMTLLVLGRLTEAAGNASRALTVARQVGRPAAEAKPS